MRLRLLITVWAVLAAQVLTSPASLDPHRLLDLDHLGQRAIIADNTVDQWPYLIQIRKFFHEKTSRSIRSIIDAADATSDLAQRTIDAIHDFESGFGHIRSTMKTHANADFETALALLRNALQTVPPILKKVFPANTLDHGTRHNATEVAVQILKRQIASKLETDIHMSRDQFDPQLDRAGNATVAIIDEIGDIMTNHPEAVAAILLFLFSGPEAFLVPDLLEIFGFASRGVLKDSLAAWYQKVFLGDKIPAGSIFSRLQSLAMSQKGWGRWILDKLRGLTSLFAWLGSWVWSARVVSYDDVVEVVQNGLGRTG